MTSTGVAARFAEYRQDIAHKSHPRLLRTEHLHGELGFQPRSAHETGADRDTDVVAPLTITDPHGFPPDAFFDRHWALAVVEQAMSALRAETESNDELARFEILQRWLVTPADRTTAITAARSLEMTDGAFKVAVHRLRKRFRQIVADHIAATVEDPLEVQDELNYLVSAMTSDSSNG